MIKIAAIIAGVLLMAGVALAGTLTSLDSTNSPTIGTTTLPAVSTERQEDRAQENELEQRGRANEPGEDVRGPCDELEHANDPRCAGARAAGDDDNGADDRGNDDRGHDDSSSGSSGPGPNSGPSESSGHDGGGGEDNSGPGGGEDNSGPGGGHDD
jgi:hypothetical protein